MENLLAGIGFQVKPEESVFGGKLQMPDFCGEFPFGSFFPELHLQETEGKEAIHSFRQIPYCESAVHDLYCTKIVWKHLLPFPSEGWLFNIVRTQLF